MKITKKLFSLLLTIGLLSGLLSAYGFHLIVSNSVNIPNSSGALPTLNLNMVNATGPFFTGDVITVTATLSNSASGVPIELISGTTNILNATTNALGVATFYVPVGSGTVFAQTTI